MTRIGNEMRTAACAGFLVLTLVAVQVGYVQASPQATSTQVALREELAVPADYVIGPDDVLSIVFWRDADMTKDVVVRPDGKITLPLINDIQAAGLKPEELRERVTDAASKLIEGPAVTVTVKEIKSRRVFITGSVASPAHYPLLVPTTVLQLIATAGGLQEFANKKNISIIREENGRPVRYQFNYNDVQNGRNLQQNIQLKPGDTVIVP